MEIIHDKANKQFVLPLAHGLKAKIVYTLNSTSEMSLVHSEVPDQLRGQGIGRELVLKTFEKLTQEGYRTRAVCSYIKAVAQSHPKWNAIIR